MTNCKFTFVLTMKDQDIQPVFYNPRKAYVEAFGEPDMAELPQKDTEAWVNVDNIDADLDMNGYNTASYPCITDPAVRCGLERLSNRLWIGLKGQIVLWHKNSVINIGLNKKSLFWDPNSQLADRAAVAIWKAATIWNDANVGVKFNWTTDYSKCDCLAQYGGDYGDVWASSFFPNDNDLNILHIYRKSIRNPTYQYMPNVMLHELGHMLGLRHEFAASEGGAFKVGSFPPNPLSVMSYTFPPQLQATDWIDTNLLYSYYAEKDGKHVNGIAVQRVNPSSYDLSLGPYPSLL